jgi:hypothetical protein
LFFGCPSGGGIRNPPTVPKINRVEIENYKSIERVDFEARRVNVFIGGRGEDQYTGIDSPVREWHTG